MHPWAAVVGFALIFIILGDAFETIILPRRVRRKFRFTRLFYRYTWLPWRALAGSIRNRRRRDSLLGFFGPLSLILLLVSWALLLIVGFALLQWAWGTRLDGDIGPGFRTALYFSGTTFTTLGLGDIKPVSAMARFFTVWEGGTGFGFLAIIIGYLPVTYQAFSRRENNISLLDARAGSPPAAVELIRRYAASRSLQELDVLLHEWEHWAAELLESHISYPVLTLFRSQHSNESWVGALTTILDTCAMLIVGVDGANSRQAQLTFAMARHALVDLAQVLNTPPKQSAQNRLPPADFDRLRNLLATYAAPLRDGPEVQGKLAELRQMYEPYVNALASYLIVEIPGWFAREGTPDNWQTSAWERSVRRTTPEGAPLPDEHL